MARFPKHYAPFLYGIIQSGLTTAIATAIATLQTTAFGLRFVMHWLFGVGIGVDRHVAGRRVCGSTHSALGARAHPA